MTAEKSGYAPELKQRPVWINCDKEGDRWVRQEVELSRGQII